MIPTLLLAAGLAGAPVTFNDNVAPIIFKRCVECHQPGGAAPFSLTTYADVRRRASLIVDAVERRKMPPWMPDRAASAQFARDRRLSSDEVALIKRWAQDGWPEGAAEGLPAPPTHSRGWTLGAPDLVVTTEPFDLPPDGGDIFRTFVVKAPVPAERYVRAYEFRASAPGAVHHANIKVDRTDSSRVLDVADPGPGYEGAGGRGATFPDGHFLGWTPGQSPRQLPEGFAWSLAPNSDLVVELHMVTTGRPQVVQASVGLYFSERPPQERPLMVRLGRQDIDIAPELASYTSEDSYVLPTAVTVLALQPHAHRLATSMHGWATLPDGSIRPLISIPDWDMSWQDTYELEPPLRLPAGSRLSMSFTYNNSSSNPRAPSPPERVRFGQASRSEMGDLWVQVLPESEKERTPFQDDVSKMMLRADIAGVETMLAVGPDSARLRTDLAFCYVDAGRLSEAIQQLRIATRLMPESAPTRHDLAVLLLREQRYDEARDELLEAVRLRPEFFEAYVNLGIADFAEQRLSDAVAWYERSLAIAPNNPTAHYNLAVAYESIGDLSKAGVHYERTLALVSQDIDALLGLARLLVRQGRIVDAATRYRQLLSIAPSTPGALLDLAWLLSTTKEVTARVPNEAIGLAERALTLPNVDRPTSLDVLAAAYGASGQFERAIMTARQALELIDSGSASTAFRADVARRLASYERMRTHSVAPQH